MTKIVFRILAVLFIIGIGLAWLDLDRLKKKHIQVWIELGSPSLILNNSISNNLKVMRFMWRNEHRRLNDEYLNRIIALEKILFLIYSTILVAFIAVLSIKGGS